MTNPVVLNNIGGEPPRKRGGLLTPANFRPILPPHTTFVETRGSAGAWLFWKPRSLVETLNDCDGEAVNLSRVMMESAPTLRTLHRYVSLLKPGKIISLDGGDDRIARAAQFFIDVERALTVIPVSGSRIRRRLPLNLKPEVQQIDRALDRLRRVQIEDTTTLDILPRYDWSRAYFLCDERARDWKTQDGEELTRRLDRLVGKVTLIVGTRPAWLESSRRWKPLDISKTGITTEEVWLNF
jgi:hypothetical protein